MPEYYVLMLGANPTEITTSRKDGVTKLLAGAQATETELRQAGRFLERDIQVGEGILIVGLIGKPDRRLVRVVGP